MINQAPARRRRLGRWSPAVGLLALLAAGCASTTASLTPGSAQSFVQAFDKLNAEANHALNIGLQNKDEEGISAQIDDSFFSQARDSGEKSLAGYAETPKWQVSMAVPGHGRIPQNFYALTETKGHPNQGMLLGFQYSSAVSSWKVLYEVGLDGFKLPPFSRLSDGRSVSASPAAGSVAALAALWAQYSGTGNSAKGFVSGSRTTGQLNLLRQSVAEQKAAGGVISYSFSVNSTKQLAVAVKGGEIVLGAIDQTDNFHPSTASACTVQNSARTVWNPLVKPGSYRSVSLRSITEVAILVPTHGLMKVAGTYPGTVSASTTSCTKATPGTTE